MITKDRAIALHPGTWLYAVSRGKVIRARVNGKCQIWKTRPTVFKLPMKYGLKECFYITPAENASEWHIKKEDCLVVINDNKFARN